LATGNAETIALRWLQSDGELAQLLEGLGDLRDRRVLQQQLFDNASRRRRSAPRYIAKSPRCIYKPLVVARTGEDLHDYVLFADRILASEAHAGCLCRLLRAFSDSIDRADIPVP
jgi:hypothetical protein